MILGSLAQLEPFTIKGKEVSVALVARRSTHRAGTRHWRRGVGAGRGALGLRCEVAAVSGLWLRCCWRLWQEANPP
jgi:hypothetical protein